MQSTMASIMEPAWQNVISLNSSLKVLFRRLLFKLSVHLRQIILARLPISSHLEWILFRQSEFVAFARRNSTLMGERWDKTVSHSAFIGYYFRGLSCSYSEQSSTKTHPLRSMWRSWWDYHSYQKQLCTLQVGQVHLGIAIWGGTYRNRRTSACHNVSYGRQVELEVWLKAACLLKRAHAGTSVSYHRTF